MIEIRQTAVFSTWLAGLRDEAARVKITVRIVRMAGGNFGNVRIIGSGVSEMKIDFGPGYRVYFVRRGARLFVLLCGGDKSSQDRDIKTAKAMAKDLE